MKKLIIEYNPAIGEPVGDALAEQFVDDLITSDEAFPYATVSTENVCYVARLRCAQGKCDLEFHYEGKILAVTKHGRLESWPRGFCDRTEGWLHELMRLGL